MKIAVLGTGSVGRRIGGRLVELGHETRLGSRSAEHPDAVKWAQSAGARSSVATFADAASFGELIFNCTAGGASLQALATVPSGALDGKVLVDVANPIRAEGEWPESKISLSIVNTDSLGEQIQRAYPQTRVVKALNTMNNAIMVDPTIVPGSHNVFICGNDEAAKARVGELLQSFGWPAEDIVDLGDITAARGTEMYLILWLRLLATVDGPFNIKIVR